MVQPFLSLTVTPFLALLFKPVGNTDENYEQSR
jgi:hypothetical protein